MTPRSLNSLLPGNGSVNISPTRKRTRNNRRVVFSVVTATLIATQRCSKRIFARANQQATIEEALFSVGAAPRPFNKDLVHLEWEQGESPVLAVGRIIEKRWQRRLHVCCSYSETVINPLPGYDS
jgi:hypothetical protein